MKIPQRKIRGGSKANVIRNARIIYVTSVRPVKVSSASLSIHLLLGSLRFQAATGQWFILHPVHPLSRLPTDISWCSDCEAPECVPPLGRCCLRFH